MWGKRFSHALDQCRGQGMVGKRRAHHALLEGLEICVVHGHLEPLLGHLLPGPGMQRAIHGRLGGSTHFPLIVEQAHDAVERTIVDGL